MGLLRIWNHRDLWCHRPLNKHDSQHQRKQLQVIHHDMLLFVLSANFSCLMFADSNEKFISFFVGIFTKSDATGLYFYKSS